MKKPLVDLQSIVVEYTAQKKKLTALNNVSIQIHKGETLGVVGESGCGKSTLGKTALLLEKPDSGKVFFNNHEITALSSKELRPLRKEMQMVFQDPDSSLNPRMTVSQHFIEALSSHNLSTSQEALSELTHMVELSPKYLDRYPFELSGGQKQRVAIGRALSINPSFIVLDEPLSSLDTSIRLQVLKLLIRLQKERDLTYLFITHDLATLHHLATNIAVLYLGHLVEIAPAKELYSNPLHPYTRALIDAIPYPDPVVQRAKKQTLLIGEMPSAFTKLSGCPFYTRCPFATRKCAREKPWLKGISEDHSVSCHLF